MSVLCTAIFSAASIVRDREFGSLREMLVAPVSRPAIVIGKCPGGATVATFQGIIILALAGAARVPYNPVPVGWQVPIGLSLGMVAVMGAALLGIAIAEFLKTE